MNIQEVYTPAYQQRSLSIKIIQLLKQRFCIIGRVILYNLGWIYTVNLINILSKFTSGAGFDLLDFFEPLGYDKRFLGLLVRRQGFGELGEDVLKDLRGRLRDEGLKRG